MGDIDLESYYLQLQQVEAALTSDPTNDELLKLKEDLKEVIELTKEILEPQAGSSSDYTLESSSSSNNYVSTTTISEPVVIRNWKVGQKCLAPWRDDGKLYEAVIEEILDGGKVSVGFPAYSHGSVTNISSLKPLDASHIPVQRENPISNTTAVPTNNKKGAKESLAERKIAIAKQKEYLKKRREKKLARVQVQEQSREKDKKKWINFFFV